MTPSFDLALRHLTMFILRYQNIDTSPLCILLKTSCPSVTSLPKREKCGHLFFVVDFTSWGNIKEKTFLILMIGEPLQTKGI